MKRRESLATEKECFKASLNGRKSPNNTSDSIIYIVRFNAMVSWLDSALWGLATGTLLNSATVE